MARRQGRVNVEWETPIGAGYTWEHVELEVLMDIRAELAAINRVLRCPNFVGIPRTLASIRRAMPTRKKKARAA